MSLGATAGGGGVLEPGQQRTPSPQFPADHVLSSGAVLFPGVFDQHGCPLIVFPVETQTKLSELGTAEVVDFITYFKSLHSKKQEKHILVSVVTDLRDSSLPTIRFIAETLLLLEQRMRAVHSVYIIWPKKKAVKLLLKFLNPSKSNVITFRMILLKEVSELSNYIDRSQLPASLGGYFMYCHENWVSFVKEIHTFVQEFLSVLQRLPSFISTLQALSRLPLPSTLKELQLFCGTNKAEYLQLRRELGLDELLRHSETVVDKLRHPDRDPSYQAMAGTAIFTQTAFDMLQNHSRITAAVEKVEVLWRQAFSKARLQLQLVQLRSDALQVTDDIEALRERLQLFTAETVQGSARAAAVLTEFETNIYSPAMVLARHAEHVIRMLEEIFPLEVQTRESWVLDLNRLKENLYSEVHFILQTLRAVSSFHHSYSKVSSWYHLVLCENFLQELFSVVQRDPLSTQPGTSPAWRQRLSSFLEKNPSPDVEELLHLAELSDAVPDDELQRAGRQVSQRCQMLRELLIPSGPASMEQLQLALQWQHELLHSSMESHFSDVTNMPSEPRHTQTEDAEKEVYLPATSPAVSEMVSADGKAPSPITSHSGFDGARSSRVEASGVKGLQRSAGDQESVRLSLNIVDVSSLTDCQYHREEMDRHSFGISSIQISPKVEMEPLNVDIEVKRSAAAPDNPWLSLPVDDLDNLYTGIGTPKPQRTDLQVHEASYHHAAADPTNRSGGQHPQTDVDPELNLNNILSSTNPDGRDQSIFSTNLWDSYHHQSNAADSVVDVSLTDWEVKEQASLREVEKILHRADGILKEEENALVQEAELDALLTLEDRKGVWGLGDCEDQLERSPSELSEARVDDLKDHLHPAEPDGLSQLGSNESAGESDDDSEAEPSVWDRSLLNCTSDLQETLKGHAPHRQPCIDAKEMDALGKEKTAYNPEDLLTSDLKLDYGAFNLSLSCKPKMNDSLTEPETLHSDEMYDPAPSFTGPGSAENTTPDLSNSFVLNPNVKEHHNNNNNVLLSSGWDGSSVSSSEMIEEKADPLAEPDRVQLTDKTVQSSSQKHPSQELEFYPGGAAEVDEDRYDGFQNCGAVRTSACGLEGLQTQMYGTISEITDFNTPIVLDTGSGLMKAGFADRELPNIIFPTLVRVPKYEEIMNGNQEREMYIGHDAQHMRGVLALKYPIKNGIITNWDDMEKIWHHTFQHLMVDPAEHPILLTEAAMNPLENRQRMVQIMFESLNVPFTYVAIQAVLALYAAGRTTGVVCDSGGGVTHSVPVFEGYCLPHAVQRFPLAGADVTMNLKKLLQEQGVCMRTTAEDEIVREMKERCCYVALNYEAESSCRGIQYTMPDGQVITLETERFRAPEILFKPELIGHDYCGMHESLFKSVVSSDMDLRRSLLGNIVLSGGNTLLPGLPERLQSEIKGLVPVNVGSAVSVTSPKGRDFLVWSGGAVLASMPTFSSAWISQEEYEEYGPQIVFRKCF